MKMAAACALPLLAVTAMAFPPSENLWSVQAKVLIMKGGGTVLRNGVEYIECTAFDASGVAIGTYSTPVAVQDFESPIIFQTSGGSLQGTFGSTLEDGIFADGAFGALEDAQNGEQYFVFNGRTRVGGSGDWVGKGAHANVETIIWRCKFELETDGNGDLVIDPATRSVPTASHWRCP